MENILLRVFKLSVAICVVHILCDAKPTTKKIVKGKLQRGKRDVDILAECDLQCLSDDEIHDYELLIEYDYGPEVETASNFYSDDNNKKCSYACKILDMEKTDDKTGTGPGEYSVSFEDGLLSNFRPNVEESTVNTTSTLPSTTSSTATTTLSTSPIHTTTGEVNKPNGSNDELLKQCLDLFAAFETKTPQNSSHHPCAYFGKKVATVAASAQPYAPSTTTSEMSSSTTTSSTTTSTDNGLLTSEMSSFTTTSSTTTSPNNGEFSSTNSTSILVPTGDTAKSLENPPEPGSELVPDISQDIALRMLPVSRRKGSDRNQSTKAPKRVIPKIIRYTVVEAEMVEEGGDGNDEPAEVVDIHQIDPEVIKSVVSSMSHISSGLASIKNISKGLPLKHQYELREPESTVKSNHELATPVEVELDEDVPESPTESLSEIEMILPTPTAESTSNPNIMNSTEQTISSDTIRVSSVSETTSLRPADPTTPIDRKPNLLYDTPFDAPFVAYNPNIPAAHFTRNKTKTFITSQNVTSVQTNQTLESYAYDFDKDDGSTTTTSRTTGKNNLTTAANQPMANFAARTSDAHEASQSSFKESNLGDKVTQSPLALEGQTKARINETTQSPVEEKKEAPDGETTARPLEERKRATGDEVIQSPLEERNESELLASTTETILKNLPTEAAKVLSSFPPAKHVTEVNFRESVIGDAETTTESATEPFSDLNSTPVALEEFDSSLSETTTQLSRETDPRDALNIKPGSNLSSLNPERDFTFSGKFSAKDNSSYPVHFKNTLIENLKKLDNNASVEIAPEKEGGRTKDKLPNP